jgi:hypothetical protein
VIVRRSGASAATTAVSDSNASPSAELVTTIVSPGAKSTSSEVTTVSEPAGAVRATLVHTRRRGRPWMSMLPCRLPGAGAPFTPGGSGVAISIDSALLAAPASASAAAAGVVVAFAA